MLKKLTFWAFAFAAIAAYLSGCGSISEGMPTETTVVSSVMTTVTTTTAAPVTTTTPLVMEDPAPTRTHADILAELEIARKRCDWDNIQKLMNEIIELQDKNFYSVEVETK